MRCPWLVAPRHSAWPAWLPSPCEADASRSDHGWVGAAGSRVLVRGWRHRRAGSRAVTAGCERRTERHRDSATGAEDRPRSAGDRSAIADHPCLSQRRFDEPAGERAAERCGDRTSDCADDDAIARRDQVRLGDRGGGTGADRARGQAWYRSALRRHAHRAGLAAGSVRRQRHAAARSRHRPKGQPGLRERAAGHHVLA